MTVQARRRVDVARTVARFPLLAGVACSWRPLVGGLSHHIYLVETDADAADTAPTSGGTAGAWGATGANAVPRQLVLRVLEPAVSAAGLGIAPADEIANTRLAVHSGVGAAVLDVLDDPPAVLLEYLAGQTLSAAEIPGRLTPIAAACRRLHAGPAFVGDFDILAKRAELLATCDRYDLAVPPGYRERGEAVAAIGAALERQPLPRVPCHNDLLAENFVEQPDGLVRIIDYQLSGNNDPTFELGDIAAEALLDPDQTVALAGAYFGAGLTPALAARTRLQLILSNVTWTLWFAVHHGLLAEPPAGPTGPHAADPTDQTDPAGTGEPGTTQPFDYQAEASVKWRRACRDLDAPDLGALLEAAAGRRVPGSPPSPPAGAGDRPTDPVPTGSAEHSTNREDTP